MPWNWNQERSERIELRLAPLVVDGLELVAEDDLRLFPIVGADLCYPVAALLVRGKLEDAGQLVPDRAWVASTPLYG